MRTTYVQRREQRRLGQLGVCVVLFAAVLVGKGIFPQGFQIESHLTQQNSFSAQAEVDAFSALGSSIVQNSVWTSFGRLVGTMFGGTAENTAAPGLDSSSSAYQDAKKTLNMNSETTVLEAHLKLPAIAQQGTETGSVQDNTAAQAQQTEQTTAAQKTDTTAAAPTQEKVVQAIAQASDNYGDALPPNVTTLYYSLGLTNTVTPVKGVLSSSFGWRTHPVSGVYKFHFGTDIAADVGTKIAAFADGTVEYVGQSNEYGLYVQIQHSNNVKTFYCHCSKICVNEGQTVKAGDKIAEVGSTGDSTGPHLHFEVKKDGIFLNAINYINLS
jgi:murein DD-endopeptidase MepM/ murein hydrolase activator NlpD